MPRLFEPTRSLSLPPIPLMKSLPPPANEDEFKVEDQLASLGDVTSRPRSCRESMEVVALEKY